MTVQPAPRPTALPASPVPAAPAGAGAGWASQFGSPTVASDVSAVAVSGEQVWVGGGFTYGFAGTANDTFARVAHWDGSGWHPLGAGVDGPVRALAVSGTHVYVGGELTSAGGAVAAAHLARWDGAAWSAVAGGVSDPDRPYGTTVLALACDGRTLVVGGTFTRAGDVPVNSLAALDLATGAWDDLGGGVISSWSSEPATVAALALHGRTLYVGGSFDRAGGAAAGALASVDLDSGRWSAYGDGVRGQDLPGSVTALAVDAADGTVYVGGSFTSAGGVRAWNLAALQDRAFRSLGDVSSYGAPTASVRGLAVSGGSLYLGGEFTAVGGLATANLARWDGTGWHRVGEPLDSYVSVLAAIGAEGVVVLGEFTRSGDLRLPHGATWTGAGWRTFGRAPTADGLGNGAVHALLPVAGGVCAGGLFDQAGELPVGSLARWTDGGWDALRGGVGAAISHGQVFALAELGGDLYAAGRFDTAGGVVARNIARWDGTAWSPLGDGLDDTAYALAVLGGRLYVGGTFTLAGRVSAGHLACWDPAAREWQPVGGSPVYDDDIRALAVIGDRWLVVGGTFHRFFHEQVTIVEGLWGMTLFDTAHEPSQDVLRGYRLLEGTSRYGAPGWVDALQVLGGDLYVGGSFDVAGKMALGDAPSDGFPAANLAVWHFAGDGSWEGVGGGTDDRVGALAAVGAWLAAGGWFSTAGGAAAARVAVFDPAARRWSALGTGLGDGDRGGSRALSLAAGEAGLWVGGDFPVAGDAPSANLALWTGPLGL